MCDKKLTSKEKIDKILGIQENQSIDDFLDSLTIDKTDELSGIAATINDEVKQNLADIDSNLKEIKSNAVAPTVLVDIDSSMKEIEDLIQISKKMFKHVYSSIISCELVDSELVSSASKLLEAIHINIAEFLSLYKDKMKYIERIKIMTFQQEQRKELMRIKHEYDMKKIQQQVDVGAVDAEGKVSYSVEDLTKILNNIDTGKN